MSRNRLVIVESPAKAKTIAGYLGEGFVVESSIGHIRDLPNRASEIPKDARARFGTLGVDVDGEFEPYYIVDPDKKHVVTDLKRRLADADELLLATDEDREGEAIAWHLLQVLKPKKSVPVRRMVFHEITKEAIARALDDTREIDASLVDAQETRRVLDRLYGYELSPVLWKKVMPRLSAGRVQSVATRLVVERERERVRFVSAAYWDLEATLDPDSFTAKLVALDGRRIAQGRDFGPNGRLETEAVVVDRVHAEALAAALRESAFVVDSVDEKPYTRRPTAPFRTSTLQQEASRKLRFTSQTTMRVAQRLYENGHITYMRTDSVTLSDAAVAAARAQAAELYGPDTVAERPRRYDRAVANAQEAHEAIRPAGDVFRKPDALARTLSRDEAALYDLIWRRTVASQMKDASGKTVSIRIGATAETGERAEFGAAGTVITFKGFLHAYESGGEEPADDEQERVLPNVSAGMTLDLRDLTPEGHETSPPARFTEASLVKALEDRGIGRPSTYAAILGTIQDRGYVFKKGTALVPTFLAFAVTKLLEEHYTRLVDYDFTARLEEDLDRIAAGDEQRAEWLGRFYRGSGDDPGLHRLVNEHLDAIDAREVNSIRLRDSDDFVVRVGRYGPYVERGDTRVSIPDDVAPDQLTVELVEELLSKPSSERELGTHPDSGRTIVVKDGRYGPYVSEVLPEDVDEKPRTASLFSSMRPETVTVEDAVMLLSLPRTLEAPDGEEILVSNGRYGPFVRKGTETRSLPSEEALLTLTLEEALAILAKPKERRGRGAPKPPLRELGDDPGSGKPLVVKDGRFGPYVTDGETNASLRRGDDVESLTIDRALELLAERRAKGPAKPRSRSTRSRR
jgi:DNA topoisomerase I